MSPPKISVVIAAYNHAPFVRQAIESALTQSGPELEVVVTDDGSRDGTVDAIRAIADPRVRLNALPQNQGACIAFGDAVRRARGEYVAVLNSDDFFLPGKLERQSAFLDAHPEIGAVFGLPGFVDERGQPFTNPSHSFARLFTAENRPRREWLKQLFFGRNCLCHPTILIRKACYDRVGLLDPLMMQLPDWDLWVRLCAEYEIHVLPEKLTAFRILDRERNTSAPSRERLARAAWETAMVLEHYAALPEAELRAILVDEPNADRSPKVQLALAAIRVAKPGYVPFGLALLRSCLRADPGCFPVAEYFRLVGDGDPFGSEFRSFEYQLLRRSRLRRALRRCVRWLRVLNLKR
jgi:glycosyltransferase involved in cell wall biosynthesis